MESHLNIDPYQQEHKRMQRTPHSFIMIAKERKEHRASNMKNYSRTIDQLVEKKFRNIIRSYTASTVLYCAVLSLKRPENAGFAANQSMFYVWRGNHRPTPPP